MSSEAPSSSTTTSTSSTSASSSVISTVREYRHERSLKYGVNPHQHPASIQSISGSSFPFRVLNGNPGYINLLDALNSWQLVKELREATGLASAASFKHVSPAGAAVAAPLSADLQEIYDVGSLSLTPSSLAYLRARQADPKCSFGDWAALSDQVDEATAQFLKREVSDGIIAPGFDEKALEILKAKKSGGYIILQVDPNYKPPPIEYRELYGVCFAQHRNDLPIKSENLKVVTSNTTLSESAARDLLIASITAKYTQSNSVAYALDGQIVGVGAGQQSRVDCVKLAGSKVETWWLRQHPKVRSLPFKTDIKRTDRVNARIQYIEGGMTAVEKKAFDEQFTSPPEPLSVTEKEEWISKLKGVSLSSDAFFPFRDNIDQAAKRGVQFIAQPGGSVQDQAVIQAANEYGITMAFTNIRLFHH